MSQSSIFSFPLAQRDVLEIDHRKKNLVVLMKEAQITDIYIRDMAAIHYLTGLSLSAGALLLSNNGLMTLLIDGRYLEAAHKNFSSDPTLCSVVLLDQLSPEHEAIKLVKSRTDIYENKIIGFDSESLSFNQATDLLENAKKENNIHCQPHISLFREMRRQKSHLEISAIKKACELCENGFYLILKLLKEGISERELAQKLKMFWYQQGADCISFEPIIAFGINSACPHWRASNSCLKQGDIVLIDIGVCLQGYHSDMTRTFSFGSPTEPEFDTWFKATLEAHEVAKQHSFEGALPYHIDQSARDVLTKYGLKDHFVHGLGHGVGLEIHEAPRISPKKGIYRQHPLQRGDVITIEPGVYFENKGGVRLENTYYVDTSEIVSFFDVPFFPRWNAYGIEH